MIFEFKEMYDETSYLSYIQLRRLKVSSLISIFRNLLEDLALPLTLLLLQFQFSLSVVLGRVYSVVWMVDEIGPDKNMCEDTRISRIPVCNSLHVLADLGHAIEGLAFLDLVDHLPHIHLDFTAVLAGTVETH